MTDFDNLTYLHGEPQGKGLLKANPEDFAVVEDLGFEPDGEGEHIPGAHSEKRLQHPLRGGRAGKIPQYSRPRSELCRSKR